MTVYYYLIKQKGINDFKALNICSNLGISFLTKLEKLQAEKMNTINKLLIQYKNKENQINQDVKNLITIGNYRGFRLNLGLPINGRTRSNAKTAKRKLYK